MNEYCVKSVWMGGKCSDGKKCYRKVASGGKVETVVRSVRIIGIYDLDRKNVA